MPEITSHQPGAFCWVELSTTDPAAAVAFYESLFGWDKVQHDMGPEYGLYTIFNIRGLDVAAASAQSPEEKAMGVPAHWNLYVNVASADEAATKAASLGGTVIAPAFDVMDHGRMAVLQEPSGAMFMVWQAKQHIGVKLAGEPGALGWSELTTRDTKTAGTFYTAMFGWTGKQSAAAGPHEYTEFSVGDEPTIGMMAMPDEVPKEVPSYWMPYFQVTDLDASFAKATASGASVLVPISPIPGTGRFVILHDPQGAMFALFQRE